MLARDAERRRRSAEKQRRRRISSTVPILSGAVRLIRGPRMSAASVLSARPRGDVPPS
jgi:hypothetical protein